MGAVGTEIRPFEIDVPQADFDELRRRVQATRWPEQETVTDRSQGRIQVTARPRRVT